MILPNLILIFSSFCPNLKERKKEKVFTIVVIATLLLSGTAHLGVIKTLAYRWQP